MNVKSALLNGDLENEIFMKIPPGVEAKEGQVWLLHKALYGLKQASKWYLKLKGQLEELDFRPRSLHQNHRWGALCDCR